MLLHDRFIPRRRREILLLGCGFRLQPYKTATQSGVTQIAYQFCVPMVVTESRGTGRDRARRSGGGMSANPRPKGVADAIERMYDGDTIERFRN